MYIFESRFASSVIQSGSPVGKDIGNPAAPPRIIFHVDFNCVKFVLDMNWYSEIKQLETAPEFPSNSWRPCWCRVLVIIAILLAVTSCIFASILFLQSPFLPLPQKTGMSLQQVSVIFRHGTRNPLSSYPNDPHRDHRWPGGLGALTKKGMRQLYKLGQWLRGTYKSFVSKKYETVDVLVRSSYTERAIMSAQALLAAFYQPSSEDEFLPGLAWRPVPIYPIPKHEDKWITAEAPCPRLEKEWEQAVSNFRLPTNESVQYLYKELSKFSGNEMSSFADIVHLVDILRIQESNGLELPEWARNFPYHVLEQLYPDFMFLRASNAMQTRLNGGPLLKQILENMAKQRNGTDDHKLYLYSAHDITIVSVMIAMGIAEENLTPGYGAALIFELHKVDDGQDHEIKILYLNDAETTEPRVIKIPGCGEPCLLDNLAKIWKPVLPENWESECLT